ncbi:hypothetical protein D9M71_336810 [compost metagenome]
MQLLALDGGGDLGADVLQQLLVLLGVAFAARNAFDDQRADGAVLRTQRHTQPTGCVLFGLQHFEAGKRWALARSQQDRLPRADHLDTQAPGHGSGLFGLWLVVIDVIGKVQLCAVLVVQRHGKTQCRQPFADDHVDALEQRQQILCRMGRFGNRIQRCLPGLGLLTLGDVTSNGDAQLIVLGPACRPEDVHHTAILAQVAVFEVELGLTAHDFPGGVEGALAIARVHHVDHRLADHLIGAVAKNAFACRADKDEAALLIHRTDGVQQQIDITRQRRGIPVFHGSAWVPR